MKIFYYLTTLSFGLLLLLSAKSLKAIDEAYGFPRIGDMAPPIIALSTKGELNLYEDYWSDWVVLFSHPADFTPVCTSEIMAFANKEKEFNKIGCKLIGLSVDGINSHITWIDEISKISYKDMENIKVTFPIISDRNLEISKKYGMIHPNSSKTHTVRSVFIIDKSQKIRAIQTYPMEIGRNVDEIIRLVKSLQLSDSENIATPANWNPGDDVLVLTPRNNDDPKYLYKNRGKSYECPAWFFCLKPHKN